MLTTTVGSYPKVTDAANPEDVPGAWHRFDQGKITKEELETILRKSTARVLREQEEAGIDLLTDGQLWWDDPVSPFARQLKGVQVNGLQRYFDNNTYYRTTVVHAKPMPHGTFAAARFTEAREMTDKPLRAVLTGPVTWAHLAEDRWSNSFERLAHRFADVLQGEVKALVAAGCKMIQIDEPAVAFEPSLMKVAQRVLPDVVSKHGVEWWLYLYFGDITKIANQVAKLPFDVFGLDLVEQPKLVSRLAAFKGKAVALGCLDARNTKMEKEAELARLFERAAKQLPHDRLYASPSCGLEFLPHTQAQQKMQVLAKAVRQFVGKKVPGTFSQETPRKKGARHFFSHVAHD